MQLYGMYVRNTGRTRYADRLADGSKKAETRNKHMLRALIGKRVAIIATGGAQPMITGYATITHAIYVSRDKFDAYRDDTLIPAGDRYDCTAAGKWLYYLADPLSCTPIPLADAATNIVRYGRSYCSFNLKEEEKTA